MVTVSGTVSEVTGGKFANGAMTGAFVHMFNAEAQDRMAMRIAMGSPVEKAKISGTVANGLSLVGAGVALVNKGLSMLFEGMAGVAMLNRHALLNEAGQFNANNFAVDVITTTTTYVNNPIVEYGYDQLFTNISVKINE